MYDIIYGFYRRYRKIYKKKIISDYHYDIWSAEARTLRGK